MPIADKMGESRIRWYGHMQRQEGHKVAKTAWSLEVSGVRPRGRPKTRYIDTVKKDMVEAGLTENDVTDRTKWRTKTKRADPEL